MNLLQAGIEHVLGYQVDWDATGTWFGAVGTIAAVGVAIWVPYNERRVRARRTIDAMIYYTREALEVGAKAGREFAKIPILPTDKHLNRPSNPVPPEIHVDTPARVELAAIRLAAIQAAETGFPAARAHQDGLVAALKDYAGVLKTLQGKGVHNDIVPWVYWVDALKEAKNLFEVLGARFDENDYSFDYS